MSNSRKIRVGNDHYSKSSGSLAFLEDFTA